MLEHIVQMGPMGVPSAAAETARNLEHSIANAGLPNITLVGACPAEGAALGRRRARGAGDRTQATANAE